MTPEERAEKIKQHLFGRWDRFAPGDFDYLASEIRAAVEEALERELGVVTSAIWENQREAILKAYEDAAKIAEAGGIWKADNERGTMIGLAIANAIRARAKEIQ